MSQTNTINAYAILEQGGKLEKYSYEVGELSTQEVEIDVHYCGICHSDVSIMEDDWGISEYPVVPGHEVIGKISAVGDAVESLKVGEIVGLGWHSGYCGHCSCCQSGDQNLCDDAQATIVGHHGGYADRVRADAASVVAIPEGMDLKSAGPLLCAGITVFNPLVQFDVKSTDKVAVIGIGGLGHIALQFLNAWGCEVTAFTSSDSKRDEAKELGAHKTLNSKDDSELEAAAGTFDFIISTVNVKLDWNLYVSTLKPKGRLHFVGATLEPLDLAVFPLIQGQRSISGSPVGSPATIAKMLEFAQLHDIKPMIETYPMSKAQEAVEYMKSGKARYRVVLTNE